MSIIIGFCARPNKIPAARVNFEDQVESGSIFNALMGDVVEPRRQFIEENALEVKNLDI